MGQSSLLLIGANTSFSSCSFSRFSTRAVIFESMSLSAAIFSRRVFPAPFLSGSLCRAFALLAHDLKFSLFVRRLFCRVCRFFDDSFCVGPARIPYSSAVFCCSYCLLVHWFCVALCCIVLHTYGEDKKTYGHEDYHCNTKWRRNNSCCVEFFACFARAFFRGPELCCSCAASLHFVLQNISSWECSGLAFARHVSATHSMTHSTVSFVVVVSSR